MRLILKPARIWVGSLLCVRERTMSRNSEDDGTGGMSFHWPWLLLVGGIAQLVLSLESPLRVEGRND